MHKFSDFDITFEVKNFSGDKIKMDRVLNNQITVLDYKIGPSNKKENTECLTLSIQKGESKHVIFTSSMGLMDMIKKVPKANFPFKTTIVKDDYLKFT